MKHTKRGLACCLIGALLLSACSIQKPENSSSQGNSSWSISSNASQNGGSSSKGSSSGGSNSSKSSSSGSSASSSGLASGTEASSKGGSSGASTSSKGSAGTNNGDDGNGNNGGGTDNNGGGTGNNGGGTGNNGGGTGNNGGGTGNNGGGTGNNGGGTTTPPAEDHGAWDPGGDWGGSTPVYTNSAPGANTIKDSYAGYSAVVDYSNASDGYIMVQVSGGSDTVMIQITGPNGAQYSYTLTANGGYVALPLQMGSGTYNAFVGRKTPAGYQMVASGDFYGENTNWLRPNRNVNYTSSSPAIRKAYGLCMNASNDLDKVKSIYNWISRNISYDYGKANSVNNGYVPDVDSTYSTRSGICYDYAALMAAMLRSQDIPTKLVKGDAGGYHAWNEVYISGAGWITVRFYVNGGWQLMDTTYAANDPDSFVPNSANYTAQSYF